MKPKFNTSKLRSQQTIGASLITAITICFGGAAFATDWVGDTSTDWNDNTNWSGDAGTGGSQANININSPVATISANIIATPVDIVVGDGAGISGRLDHLAGTAQTGPGNWMKVGRAGGTGVYNLANSAGTGGTFTGLAQGSGTMNVKGRLYVGGENGSGSNGTVNVHTTGNLAMDSEFNIGTNASVGVVNVDSGTITNNNWLRVGAGGGATGTLNVSGGSVTKSGNDHFIVGDNGGSTGVVTLNAGTIAVNNECWIGQAGGTGTVNINGGSISNNSWVAIGRANANSHGTVNQTGGTWTKTGGGVYIIGDNSVGTYNLSGTGSLAITGEFWIGQGGSGNGTMNFSGGTITSDNWVAIGRENGTANVTMTGGTWNKTGATTQFIVGSSGPCTMNMSGGIVDVKDGGYTWVGEGGNSTTAVLNISNTAEFRSPIISVGPESPNATLNLNGGTVKTHRFSGTRERDANQQTGTGTIHFNGTQIIGTANDTAFFNQVDNTIIDAGGFLVNSNGFNLAASSQVLSGTGGVVKTGPGTLTLNGANSYTGTNTVTAGKLALGTSSTGTGNVTVANDAAFGVNQLDAATSLAPVNVTLGASAAVSALPTSLDINLGNTAGNPTVPALNVTGTLTLNRQIVVNIADQLPAVGTFPLVHYAGGAKAGAGSFVLGTLPNGVVATLSDNGTGVVSLVVTAASLPTWDGTNESGLTKVSVVTEFSTDVTVANATGIVVGQPVRGTGIPSGTTVASISGLNITLSQPATLSGTDVNLLFVTTPGTNEGVWDFTTQNWVNQITASSSVYADPNPVLFNDTATGPTAVTLNLTVAPSSVTFNNNEKVYSLAGTGKITGATGLTKSGTGSLSIGTANDYTGVTRLEGGTTNVSTLANGGAASSLGAATAAPEKLVLAGGTLGYTGGAVTIDRGLSVLAADNTVVSGITLAANVTTSGQFSATLGKILKSGPGTLTLTNAGANVLAVGSAGDNIPRALAVAEGGLVLSGTGQTNTVNGWAAFGTAAGTSSLSLLNGATLTVNGRTAIALAADSNTTVTVGGTSSLVSTDALQIALGSNSVGNVVVKDSGSINKTGGGWLSIGNDAVGTMTIQNNGTLVSAGDFNIGDVGTANGTLTLEDNAIVTSSGNVFVGKNGTTGSLVMGGTSKMTGPEMNIAGNAGSHGTVNVKGTSLYTANSRLQVGPGAGSVGSLVIEGSGEFKVNSYVSVGFNGGGSMTVKGSGKFSNTDDFSVNESGDVPATVSVEDNATMSVVRTIYVGRNAGRTGTLSVSGAAQLNQTDAGYSFVVGPLGTGTLNVLGTSQVTSAGASGLVITNNASGIGTVNLDGGTLTVRKVSDAGGTSAFHFDGGVLKAGAGADINFLSGLDTLDVEDGGAIIDSNGQTIAIAQGLSDQGGALTKQGLGTLQLNGSNTYFGSTTVTGGALGGTGSVAGELIVSSTGSVSPGASGVGTFTVNDGVFMGSVIEGTYLCEISGATADQLVVAGDLNITGAKLDIDVLTAPTAPVYVIASYDSLVGTFTVQDLPSGYTVDYNYLSGKQIALVQTSTPYGAWATGYGLNPLTDGAPGFDKDGDGQVNGVEFALGGSPISGSDNAKIYHLAADSSDVGTNKELLMTIAVRSGTPAFTPVAGGSPTATHDGSTYLIQGSTDLAAFNGTVAVVTTIAPPAPNTTPPAGYEYRTFSLEGSDGLPAKGFLRVKVSN